MFKIRIEVKFLEKKKTQLTRSRSVITMNVDLLKIMISGMSAHINTTL